MDAEKVVCYDRGACGGNDALLATLANGGMNRAWDNPFAFNSFYHDIHNNGDSEEKIFGDAYLFYFKDEDFEGSTKPFKYYKSMT